MARYLMTKPRFKKDEENPNKLIYIVEKDYIIREVYLDVMSREINFKVEKKAKKKTKKR